MMSKLLYAFLLLSSSIAQANPTTTAAFTSALNAYLNADTILERARYEGQALEMLYGTDKALLPPTQADPQYRELLDALNLRLADLRQATAPVEQRDKFYSMIRRLEARCQVVRLDRGWLQLPYRTIQNAADGALVGELLGASVLLFGMARGRPDAVPRGFAALKYLLHVAPLAGNVAGEFVIREAVPRPSLPCPSNVLDFALGNFDQMDIATASAQSEAQLREQRSFLTALIPSTILFERSGFVAWVMNGVRAIRGVNVATTPAKVNPIYLAGSFVIGFAVEKGVAEQIESRELAELDAPIRQARIDLSSQDFEVREAAAERMQQAAMRLAMKFDLEINQAQLGFFADIGKIEQDRVDLDAAEALARREFSEDGLGSSSIASDWATRRLQEKLAAIEQQRSRLDPRRLEAEQDFIDELAEQKEARDLPSDSDAEGYLVRQRLRQMDGIPNQITTARDEELNEWGTSAVSRAGTLTRAYQRRTTAQGKTATFEDFCEYLRRLDQAQDAKLSALMRQGAYRKNGVYTLLQTVADLRELRRAQGSIPGPRLGETIDGLTFYMHSALKGLVP